MENEAAGAGRGTRCDAGYAGLRLEEALEFIFMLVGELRRASDRMREICWAKRTSAPLPSAHEKKSVLLHALT
jgi:hypothetical protein